MLNTLARLLIIGALGLMAAALFIEASKLSQAETPDPSKVAIVFISIVFVVLAIGAMFALWLAPALGEKVGSFFFSPSEKAEKDIRTDAIAAVNRGDWQEAVNEFKKVLEKEPTDSVSINDIVHLYTDKLEDPQGAVAFLQGQLEHTWPPEHTVFLGSRLVEVYWGQLQDATRAREILLQIIEMMPGTRHAANAQHKLKEIENSLASGGGAGESMFFNPTDHEKKDQPGDGGSGNS